MKKTNNKKRKPLLVIIISCSIVLTLVVGAAILLGILNNNERNNTMLLKPDQSISAENSAANSKAEITWGDLDIPEKSLEVITDYGTFTLKGQWTGEIRAEVVSDDVYVIRAYGRCGSQQEQHLFDVSFGDGEGECVGYMQDPAGEYLPVYVLVPDFVPDGNWSELETVEFNGMRNELNSIIGQLNLVEENPDEIATNVGEVRVETKYVDLFYPDAWPEDLRTEVSGEDTIVVSFFGTPAGMDEVRLFDVIFAGDGENAVGVLTLNDGTEVLVDIVMNPNIPGENWEETALVECYEMLDCVNYILGRMEDSGVFIYY